jgi:hypothetical protein
MNCPTNAGRDPDQPGGGRTGASPGVRASGRQDVGAATARDLSAAGYAVACPARSTREHSMRTPGTLDDVVAEIRGDGGTAVAVLRSRYRLSGRGAG